MMALVGEQLSNSSDITGAVISIRKFADRVSLWTKSYNDAQRTIKTGYVYQT